MAGRERSTSLVLPILRKGDLRVAFVVFLHSRTDLPMCHAERSEASMHSPLTLLLTFNYQITRLPKYQFLTTPLSE